MQQVTAVGQIFDAIQRVKTSAPRFCTNLFPDQRKLREWVDHGELLGEFHDGTAFFLRKDRDFWRCYFCAASVETLRQGMTALPDLKTERVVMDVIGEEEALGEVLASVGGAGFRSHALLRRMARAGGPEGPVSPRGEVQEAVYADKTDCPVIMELLNQSFDPCAEQLPAFYEIEAAVNDRQILLARCGGTIAGLLFFETHRLTSTIRYWLVVEKFRAFRYGSALMRNYFTAQDTVRRFVLWVMADNDNAITKYRHFGYLPDKLVDHVLVNERLRP